MFLFGMFMCSPPPTNPKDQALCLKIAGVQIALLALIAIFGR